MAYESGPARRLDAAGTTFRGIVPFNHDNGRGFRGWRWVNGELDIDATKVRLSSPIYEGRGRKVGGSCCSIMWTMAEALSVVELEGRWDGGNGDSHRCRSLRTLKWIRRTGTSLA
jgi:hypothetical protein